MKATTSSLSKLASDYSVSIRTFKKWLKNSGINFEKGCRVLTPIQVRKIYDFLGEP